jgi:hypothetical protein
MASECIWVSGKPGRMLEYAIEPRDGHASCDTRDGRWQDQTGGLAYSQATVKLAMA